MFTKRAGTRIVVAGVAATVVVAGGVFVALAQGTEVEQLTPNDGYDEVTVVFTGEVTDADGETPSSANFSVEGPDSPAVDDVSADGDASLAVTLDGAAAPNVHELVFEDLYSATDDDQEEPLDLDPEPIPLSVDDLEAIVAGWADSALPLGDLGEVPVAGEWFANSETVEVDLDVGTGEDPQTELTEVAVPVPYELPDLVDVPDPDDLDDLTQDEVEAYFDGVDGVGVDFGDRAAALEFADDFAHDVSREINLEVEEVPIRLEAEEEIGFEIGLRNRFSLTVDGGDARLGDDTDLVVTAEAEAATDGFGGRVGFVDITAGGVALGLDAEADLGLACREPGEGDVPAPDDAPDLGVLCDGDDELSVDIDIAEGATADVELDELEVVAFEQDLGFSDDPLLGIDWELAHDLPEPDDPLEGADLQTADDDTDDDTPGPTIEAGPFEDAGLHHFANADVGAVGLGLDWIANWLDAVTDVGSFAEELPLVDTTPAEVADLAALAGERVEELEDVLDQAADAAERRPSAQELAEELCDLGFAPAEVDCGALEDLDDPGALLEIVTAEVGDGHEEIQRLGFPIEYDLEFDLADGLPSADDEELDLELDLDLAEALPGLTTDDVPGFELEASAGDWSGSQVSASVSFELGVDLRDGDTLTDEWDLDDVDDTELTGSGGVPYAHTPSAAELCASLVTNLDESQSLLALENGWGDNGSVADDCAAVLLEIADPDGADDADIVLSDGATETLDDGDVCAAAAGVWLRDDDGAPDTAAFHALNEVDGDGDCAQAVHDAATDADTHLRYLDERPDPLQPAHRLFIDEGPGGDLVDLAVDLDGEDLAAEVRAGILDLGVTGDVALTPSLRVALGDGDGFERDPDALDLLELAQLADAGALADVLDDVDASGSFSATLDFANDVVEGQVAGEDPIGLDVEGDLARFFAGTGELDVRDERLDAPELDDAMAVVGIKLGDWGALQDLDGAEVVEMLVGLLEEFGEAAGDDVLAFELPLIGTNLQDLTAFTRSVVDTAEGLADRGPATLSGLERALRRSLGDAGLPEGAAESVGLDVAGERLEIAFEIDETIADDYPFSLPLDEWLDEGDVAGIPVGFAPVDGGAGVAAEAFAEWHPTITIDIDGTGDLGERVSYRGNPTLGAEIDATVGGDAFLGPMTVNVDGSAQADPEVEVDLVGHLGSDGEVALADLADAELPSDVGEIVLIPEDAAFSAVLDVGPTPSGGITVDGDFDTLFLGDPSDAVTVTFDEFDFAEVSLDLRTLVQGTAQASRFVGRTLDTSDTLTEGLPLIGDELTRIADVGDDLRGFSDELEALWAEADGRSEEFLDSLEEDLACADLPGCTDLDVVLVGGETLGEADGVRVELELAGDAEGTQSLAGGLGVEGVVDLDTDGELEYTAGYHAGVAFELSVEEGFTVDGVDDRGLVELYAHVDTAGAGAIDLDVNVGGIPVASATDGEISLTGPADAGLGPDGNAAGFALGLDEPLTLRGLADRDRDPERLLAPDVALDADVELPIQVGHGLDMVPTLTAPVYFSWNTHADDPEPHLMIGDPERDLVHVEFDAIVEGLVEPILAELDEHNPVSFEPVRDRLEEEIDLLEMSARDLLEAAPVTPEIEQARTLFFFLLDLEAIADRIGEGEFDGRYNLGHIDLLPAGDGPDFVPAVQDEGDLGPIIDVFASLGNLVPTPPGDGLSAMDAHPASPQISTETGLPSEFGPVSVPLLGEPSTILRYLVGVAEPSEVTFVDVDAGQHTLGYALGFEEELDFGLGFLEGELRLGFDGGIGLTLRLGFGYDARGISSGHPINGFYLRDPMDPQGRQQQIVELGAHISAYLDGRFGIDVAGVDVASARFAGHGGARIGAGLQLFTDSPAIPSERHDNGKFHVDDMARVHQAHSLRGRDDLGDDNGDDGGFADEVLDAFCLLRPGIEFSAHLGFAAEATVGPFTVWDTEWDSPWPPLEIRTSCRIHPQPAQLVDGELILNAGPDHAGDRFDDNPEPADGERFLIGMDGGEITVEWTGEDDTALGFDELSFDPEHVQTLTGELGGHGGEVVIDDLPDDVPARLDGGGEATVEINADAQTQVRGFDAVVLNDGRNDVRTPADSTVTIAGGDNTVAGGEGTVYSFDGADGDWGATELSHRGDDGVLDFASAGGPVHGEWQFGRIEVTPAEGSDAQGLLEVRDGATVADVTGSDDDGDRFEIAGDVPDGLTVDAGAGEDNEILVDADGNTERWVNVRGNPDGTETLTVEGSFAGNEVYLRARPDLAGVDEDDLEGTLDVTNDDVEDLEAAEHGFVAMTNQGLRGDDSPIDRVDYDADVAQLVVDGNAGANRFVVDDVATDTEIEGGDGDGDGGGNDFQVGQVFGTADNPQYRFSDAEAPDRVVDDGEVRTRNVEGRGPMTLGVSHPTTIRGGDGDDEFTVYSSTAALELEGISGNNTFLLRAFIIEGGVGATGGDGDDHFEYVEDYVENGEMSIDGGEGGFNTMIAVGTELGDGFVLDDEDLFICRVPREGEDWPGVPAPAAFERAELPYPEADDDCAWEVEYDNIDMVVGHGLEGDNVFWVRSVAEGVRAKLFGGEHGADFYVGEIGELEGEGLGGDVSGVNGRVVLDGETEPEFDVSVNDPVVLPGEDDTATSEPDFDTDELGRENSLLVDARRQTDADAGFMDDERIWGLGMPDEVDVPTPPADDEFAEDGDEIAGGVLYDGMDEASVLLGDGDDEFIVHSTPTFTRELDPEDSDDDPETETIETEVLVDVGGGDDDAAVNTIAGPTEVHATEGENTVRVGSDAVPGEDAPDRASTLAGILDHLDVTGSGANTDLQLDASGAEGDDAGDVVDVAPGQVRGLSMPGEVTHTGLRLLDLALTDGSDVANIRGTSAAETRVQGLDGDDRVFVADEADIGVDDDWEGAFDSRDPGEDRVERDDDAGADTPGYLPGTLADVAGDIDVAAGDGDNLLMVSDRDSDAPIVGAELAADELRGFADDHDIRYDTDEAGTFAGGITVWTRADGTGEADADGDDVSVTGTRRDGDPTTLAWTPDHEEGHAGDDRTVTTLNTGAGDDTVDVDLHVDEDGFFVANTGAGDDTVDGSESSLGLVVVGGDGDDEITTGSGDDIVFGDHGRVEYHDDGGDLVTMLGDADDASTNDGRARRPDRIVSEDSWDPEPESAGERNNVIDVGAGDDVAFGGLGNARIEADSGRNALLGDHGEVWRVEEPDDVPVATDDGFIDVTARTGPFTYDVDVFDDEGGGDDVILGGTDDDTIFGGPGDDIIVGSPGANDDAREDDGVGDVIFGGDGDDVIWGGPGDDRIYGGHGRTFVNIKQPTFESDALTDLVHPEEFWARAWTVAPEVDAEPDPEVANGANLVYGGRGQDALQADSGGPGREDGDRLANWYGSYNLFLTCEAAYGAGWVLRQPAPDTHDALAELAEADGAVGATAPGTSGWRQLALVTDEHADANRGGTHPDHPGNDVACLPDD